MKKIVPVFLFGIVLLIPLVSSARVLSTIEEAEMLSVIRALRAQIVALTELLAHNERSHSALVSHSYHVEHSQYYDKQYTAVYRTSGYDLRQRDGGLVDPDHEEVWEMFVEIVGEDTVMDRFSEFRIYNDPSAPYDAFVDYFDNTWVLGFNMYDIDLTKQNDRRFVEELLVHEYGHVVLGEHTDALETFTNRFWSSSDRRYAERAASSQNATYRDERVEALYRSKPDSFVSEYAATNPLEDAVESFAVFLYQDVPPGNTVRGAKVRFFEEYGSFLSIQNRLADILR